MESAQSTIERAALDRTIVDVDDTDGWECHPRCGTEMARATVGGRTTWWCPEEQR